MSLKKLLLGASIPASMLVFAGPANAQTPCPTNVDGEQTRQIRTSTEDNGSACDVTVASTGSITTTTGSAVVLDSNNILDMGGQITSTDSNNTTGIELQGGNTGTLVFGGSIDLSESTEAVDTDNDLTVDGPFAEGAGRTGILISGASPFAGEITATTTSSVVIEGNDSYAFRIIEGAGLAGDLNLLGNINVQGGIPRNADGTATGGASAAVLIEGDMTGDLNHQGIIATQGEGARAIDVSGDITGGLTNGGTITNTGYRFTNRQTVLAIPDAIDATDTLQAGAAIQVSGNISEGVHLQREAVFDENGVLTGFTGSSTVNQLGSAPAILFDGGAGNITIGTIVPIGNADNPELQFAFVNQGTVTSNGVYDDVSVTTLEVRNTTLVGGINNSGGMSADAFRSSADGTPNDALSRVIVLGSGAIADAVNNSGVIRATVTENTTEIFADLDNPLAPQELLAVAIDVEANASVNSIVNSGIIQASLVGRTGTAIAIRDESGTITVIDNTGAILTNISSSDPLGNSELNFTSIAMDLRANTAGVTINQTLPTDPNPDDDIDPTAPQILGDILLGTGDDTVNLASGTITGALSFSDGADTFALSGGSTYSGTLTDTGDLVISVIEGSALNQTSATAINATSAYFDGTSSFSPTLSGQSGIASTLLTSGDITFDTGATILPLLTDVVDQTNNTFTILDAGGALNIGDLDSLLSFTSPYLYDTTFQIDPNDPTALLITLDLRETNELGLDAVQTASFATAYDALFGNQQLAEAFVNITDADTFRNAVNQLMPEFASAARHFVVANVDGAVGAVGSHLENARRSQAKPGGAWIQEFTYFADRDLAGLSEQYRGFGFGFTGGLDTAFGPFHAAGVNFGFASTEIEDVVGFDDPMDVMTFQGGLYGGIETGDFSIDLYGGGGWNDFDQTRNVRIGNFDESTDGSWSGSHVNASIRGGYDIDVGEKYWMRPAFSLDYLRLKENAYTETGNAAIALDVDGRTSELAGASAMLNVGAFFEGRRTWLRPSLRFGYRNEFVNDGVTTSYGFSNRTMRSTLVSEAFPSDGFLVGFSLAAGSEYSSFGFDFDSDIRDGFIRHTGRVVLRMIF